MKKPIPGEKFETSPGQFAPPCEFIWPFILALSSHNCVTPGNKVCSLLIDPCLRVDDPGNLEGAPTTIQIVTTRMRDEECLGLARLLDRYLRAGTGDEKNAYKL